MGERTGPLDPRNPNANTPGAAGNTTDQNVGDPALSAAVQGQPTPSNVPYQGDTQLANAVQGQPVASTAPTSSEESPEGRRINEEMSGFIAQEDAEELDAAASDDRQADNDDYDDADDEYDDRLDDGSATDDTDEIRGDIEQTRTQMSDTLDAIEAKLNPHRIAERVTETVRDATIGKAEEFMSDMSERAQDLGSTFMDTLRENAVPAALIGLGLGWLMMKNSAANRDRQQRRYQSGYRVPIEGQYRQQYYPGQRYSTTQPRYQQQTGQPSANPVQRAGQKASEALSSAQDAVGDRMSDASDNVQEAWGNVADQAQQAQSWLQRTYEDNPLLVGAAALVAGAAIAFAIPETPQENQWMGPTRDNLAQQAQATVQDTVQKTEQVAKKAASAARDAAQDEAQKQQLTR